MIYSRKCCLKFLDVDKMSELMYNIKAWICIFVVGNQLNIVNAKGDELWLG